MKTIIGLVGARIIQKVWMFNGALFSKKLYRTIQKSGNIADAQEPKVWLKGTRMDLIDGQQLLGTFLPVDTIDENRKVGEIMRVENRFISIWMRLIVLSIKSLPIFVSDKVLSTKDG